MRIDFEDLELYTNIGHKEIDALVTDSYINNLTYFEQVGKDEGWFCKSSPYYLFDVLNSRDIGIYEIWYDYVKRHIKRRSTIFDYGAGIGTLETMLLKRSPAALTAEEFNLLCMDFIYWRMHHRSAELMPRTGHYDYVISIDTLQRLPSSEIKSTLAWLLTMGDRCFIYINEDSRHPLFNEVPFDVELFLNKKAESVKSFHGLWDIVMKNDKRE